MPLLLERQQLLLTNSNGCEYTEMTIVTYVGSEDVVINETTCDAGSAEQQQ
ncbi:MAG: hypothetical protein R2753_11850 [Chitinophagales bacterium]